MPTSRGHIRGKNRGWQHGGSRSRSDLGSPFTEGDVRGGRGEGPGLPGGIHGHGDSRNNVRMRGSGDMMHTETNVTPTYTAHTRYSQRSTLAIRLKSAQGDHRRSPAGQCGGSYGSSLTPCPVRSASLRQGRKDLGRHRDSRTSQAQPTGRCHNPILAMDTHPSMGRVLELNRSLHPSLLFQDSRQRPCSGPRPHEVD